MAVPAALQEAGGDKVAGLLYDTGAANAWAWFRGIANAVQQSEAVAALQVGTQADASTWVAGGPIVVIGGLDGTTVRKAAVDASGQFKLQPQLVWDNGGAVADARFRAISKDALAGTAIGHLAVATHADGATWAAASGGIVVIGGLDNTTVRKVKVDASGRQYTVDDAVLAGTGHRDIASTGVALSLRSSTVCRRLVVKADKANVGIIYVGIVGVLGSNDANNGGYQLDPAGAITLNVQNVATVYINGTAGEGVSYAWWT